MARRRRPCAGIGPAAVGRTSCVAVRSSRSTARRARPRDRPGPRHPDRDRRARSAQHRQCPRRGRCRARASARRSRRSADGLLDFRPSIDRSPGRLNIFRLGARLVIVDFAHNEAGISALLDVAEGIAGGAAGRAAPITAIIGTAGDRPDDTLRGIGRLAAQRAQRVAVKETVKYLRGRTRESVIGELMAGVKAGGVKVADVPVYPSETAALLAELNGAGGTIGAGSGARPDAPRIVVLMCQEDREGVFRLLTELGARPVDVASELTALVPRLQDREGS